MEEWNAFVRRTRRRIEYRKRYKHGDLSGDETFYYPPRINPWPTLGGIVVLLAIVAAYVSTRDGGEPPPAAAPETTVTIPGAGGLSSRDVAACLSFQTAVSDARDRLQSAQSREGASLAASGALTEGIVAGYLRGAEALQERFDDDVLLELVTTFGEDLASIQNRGIAQEAAGSPVWAEVFPEAVETIDEFGRKFDRRCEQGGVLVQVAE